MTQPISGHVLLVDDEQMILDVDGQMLEKLGYQKSSPVQRLCG